MLIAVPAPQAFSTNQTIATISSKVSPTTSETFQGEKRAIQIRDTLFVFYHDGTNVVYKRSQNGGASWTPATNTNTGTVAADEQSWSVVYTTVSGTTYIYVLYWTPGSPNTYFKFVRGTVQGTDGTDVSWSSPVELGFTSANTNCGSNGACAAVSATTDSNGYIYSVFRWKSGGASTYSYQIKVSTNGGWDWSDSLGQQDSQSAERPVMVLTKLSSGKMLLAYARYDNRDLYYRVFDGSTWGSVSVRTDAGMTNSTNKQISADTDPGAGKGYVAFLTSLSNTNNLKIARFSNTGSYEGYESRSSDGLNHKLPSITFTSDGTIHIYTIASSKIYETKRVSGTWQTPSNPYGTSFSSLDRLTAGVWYAGAIWTEGTSPNYSLKYQGTEDIDQDNDGLLDSWETNGIDSDSDGTIDFTLQLQGASKFVKDIFVEVDYMDCDVAGSDCAPGGSTDHRPTATAINTVVSAFDNAPVSNPGGSPNGINLWVTVDEGIPHDFTWSFPDPVDDWPDFETAKAAYFGTAGERASADSADLLAAKRMVYHYAVYIHGMGGPSGIAELPGDDLVIALGGSLFPPTHGVGDNDEQAAAFMHELGHNIGLRHGGGVAPDLNNNGIIDEIAEDNADNCKPNYVSVMSYGLEYKAYAPLRTIDYSRSVLSSLNEFSLSEPAGVGASDPSGRYTAYGPVAPRQTQTGIPVNWNRDTSPADTTDTNVSQNINNFGISGCSSSNQMVLHGFDDWDLIDTNGIPNFSGPNGSEGANYGVRIDLREMTFEDVKIARLSHLENLKSFIEHLPSSALVNATQVTAIKGTLNSLVDRITELVEEDDLAGAVSVLEETRTTVQGASLVIEPNSSNEMVSIIDTAIAAYTPEYDT